MRRVIAGIVLAAIACEHRRDDSQVSAEAIRCSTNQSPRVERDDSPMCWVPAGTFVRRDRQRVRITRGFLIDQHEVTASQFIRFLRDGGDVCLGTQRRDGCSWYDDAEVLRRDGGFSIPEGGERRPVGAVPHTGAAAYCAWAGKRLPTEAEWELAAQPDDERVPPRRGLPRPVETAPADRSRSGAYDMAGNADEWVADCFRERTDCETDCIDPLITTACKRLCESDRADAPCGDAFVVRTSPQLRYPRIASPPGIGHSFRCAFTPVEKP